MRRSPDLWPIDCRRIVLARGGSCRPREPRRQVAPMTDSDSVRSDRELAPTVSWRERLRVAIDASGRTQSAIAASAGVSPETLSRVLSGVHAQPAFETVVRIAHAVGESVGTLLDEPAFI